MTKATKQGVFDSLLATYEGTDKSLVDEFGGAPEDIQEWRDEYAAALQVPLPVIPRAVGERIRFEKRWGENLYHLFVTIDLNNIHSAVEDWIAQHSDTFAIAWSLNEWEEIDG